MRVSQYFGLDITAPAAARIDSLLRPMTTGTIIFIVVLVLQAVIRAAAKAEEKKKAAAAQMSAAGVTQKVETKPQTQPQVLQQPVIKDFVDAFKLDLPSAVVEARPSAPVPRDEVDQQEVDQEPEGEATAGYLHQRVEQIHSGALIGRRPQVRVPESQPATVSESQAPVRAMSVRKALSSRGGLRTALVMGEVLGPPVCLKQPA